MTNEKEVENVYAEVVREFGKINATVNNAGVAGVDKPTHELTEKNGTPMDECKRRILLHQTCHRPCKGQQWQHRKPVFHLWDSRSGRYPSLSCFQTMQSG